ncbi:hypothetical protein GQ44DRAFT_750068 [Phaeosphaeriaceae sp. PMI808]|nr:hypothetical protein GQ44DRAFT_750068 [Phaeosphaeriaceae sp. PMI808]
MSDSAHKPRRQRAILSCTDCRRRKLKCDRLFPCNRCTKRGIAASCAYGPEGRSNAPEQLKDRPKKRLRRTDNLPSLTIEEKPYTHDSLEHSERADVHLRHDQEPKDQVEFLAKSPDLKSVKSTAFIGILKGHSYGTHFYGPSSSMSVIAHFADLRYFMKEVYSNSTARRLSQDIKASEDQARAIRPFHRFLSIPKLRSLLPDRCTVDLMLNQYFATFETTFRIIHVPAFKIAYENYWESLNEDDTEIDAIILAILACTICTSTHGSPRYNHSGSSFHSKAVVWIRACEVWLKRQSNKHRSLASLQVRCLRLLALTTTSLKVKEYFQEVQAHVALMRSYGMHRDPSIYGTRCSPFEGEMRRRLWATTVELELQASTDKGTSSMICSLDNDCAPPRNIDDTELTPNIEELPRPHGMTTYTDTSFLHLAMQSIGLRAEMCSKINSIKDVLDIYDIFEYEDALREHISSIPHWTDPRSLQTRTLLELNLWQFVVGLHTPRALQAESRSKSDHRYSVMTTLEAAAAMIRLHNNLEKSENYALLLTRNDYFRAMVLICHIAYHAKKADDTIMMRLAKQIFDESVDKAIHLQEERTMRPGRGSQYFWYLSAAVSLVGIQFKPSQSEALKRQAADRVAKLLHKVLALHDDPTTETLATEVSIFVAESPAIDLFTNGEVGLDTLGFGDMSEWMMDDFWFLNVPDNGASSVDPALSYL